MYTNGTIWAKKQLEDWKTSSCFCIDLLSIELFTIGPTIFEWFNKYSLVPSNETLYDILKGVCEGL